MHSGGSATIITAKAAKPMTMTTLSDMADSLANEIRQDQYHHQRQLQQQQQQYRRAKRDKHPVAIHTPPPPPLPTAIFEDEISSATLPTGASTTRTHSTIHSAHSNTGSVSAKNAPLNVVVVPDATILSPVRDDDTVVNERVKHEPTAKNEEEKEDKPQENNVNAHEAIDQTTMDRDSESIIAKGDYVKVFYDATDMFGDMNLEWYD